ncbi:DUF1801 domain-containing protein [Thalassoroseus pseudoceratinae]|uniref:DUF1801 domain-containing protein n=1 Tax=Thalassoroseus pseudoceratinae TaxID=2713176 RepID=UPI0014241832|nr:YdeI/OmpD-associated family protein [Thalassoroseus pseudoceratinae]
MPSSTGTNSDVDDYFRDLANWQDELAALRKILLDTELTEDFKWRAPCYTHQGKNIVILAELKDCCTLGFFKGALLGDPLGILEKSGENTRSARVIRFTDTTEIERLKPTLKSYLTEAIEVEKSGRKVEAIDHAALEFPLELQEQFEKNPELKTAFTALTPGRQRGYVLHFSSAKQSKTRTTRIERYTERILDGKGLNDCTCGLSKKMPGCDGSHKQIR